MPPLRGLGLFSHIAFFLIFQVTCALKLDFPPDIFVGENVTSSWTSGLDDPRTMSLYLSCNRGASYQKIAPVLPTSLHSRTIAVTPGLVQILKLQLPASCNLQARTTDGVTVLDGVMFEMSSPATSTIIPNSIVTTGNKLSPTSTDTTGETLTVSSFSSSNIQSLATSLSMTSPPDTLSFGSSDASPTTATLSTSHSTNPTSKSTQTSATPIGAIVGGVVGGSIGLAVLATFLVICLRRRRPPLLLPVPLPNNENYIQPSDKNSQLAQITNEREAAQQQRDQLQTEAESIHLHENTGNGPSGLNDSRNGPFKQQMEALWQRVFAFSIICLRRRRPPPPLPVPLPYNENYVQPLDKNSRLAQITSEREAAQRQHDELQTEAESIRLRESTHNGPSGLNNTLSGSELLEQRMEALQQRVLELEAQQRDLEHQLYSQQMPPRYSN